MLSETFVNKDLRCYYCLVQITNTPQKSVPIKCVSYNVCLLYLLLFFRHCNVIMLILKKYIFSLCVYVSVPSRIGAHCPYFQNGHGILVVWNQPYGVWTDVEVIVAGQNHTVHQDAEQSVIMSGLQPATTHHVSVTVLSASLSGPPSRSETFHFSCLTDPRGECRHIFPPH